MDEPFHSGPLFEGGVDADYYRDDNGNIHRVRRDGTVEYWTCLRWSPVDPYRNWLERRAEQGTMAL
jgi:hypothetical protein